ncbi:MAG: hypothetical protein ACKOPO_08000 [Novosphingobium sp.]
MIGNIWKTTFALAATLALSACGDGGGGGGVVSTPIAPAETYPDTANANVRTLTANETFSSVASKGIASYDVKLEEVTSGSVASATDFAIRYDASDNAYTISSGGKTYTQARSGLTVSTVNANVLTGGNPDVRDLAGGSGLILLNPDKFTLTYVDVGFWREGTRSGDVLSSTLHSFAYGVETPDSAVPRSGSASFLTLLVGAFVDDSNAYSLGGSATIAANFQSGLINFSGGASAATTTGTRVAGIGNITGTGQISSSSNNFTGSLTAQGVSFLTGNQLQLSGIFTGRFFGPAAQEVGGSLQLFGSDNQGNVMGAIAGFAGTTGPSLTK